MGLSNITLQVIPQNAIRDLTQNTTKTVTRTSSNNKFEEQNNSCARAL